jgi:hypothetical protein
MRPRQVSINRTKLSAQPFFIKVVQKIEKDSKKQDHINK